jgi:hypothetical protein
MRGYISNGTGMFLLERGTASQALVWGESWINGPIGPPSENKFLEYLFSGLEPPWKGYRQQPVVFRAWLLWFGEQWK